jgi:hypothetical protein
VIAYGAMLDVPRELVGYVSRLLAAQRRARGTRKRTRALTCWRHSLFVLAWFRKREDLTVLGAGFGISRATAYRYRDEAVMVLAAQAPELTEALHRVQQEGWAFVILDGKIVDTDRLRVKTISRKGETIDLWYSGKRHDFGGNIQAVMRPLPNGMPGTACGPDSRPGTAASRSPRRYIREADVWNNNASVALGLWPPCRDHPGRPGHNPRTNPGGLRTCANGGYSSNLTLFTGSLRVRIARRLAASSVPAATSARRSSRRLCSASSSTK